MKKLFQALALLAAFVLLIALPQTAADGVRSALTLCGRVILPSLFPFFVCSNLFLLLGYSARLSARFGGAAAKLLRLPPAAGSAFLLGLLGGYPAGAQAAGTLYARGELSGANAERALAVCNQAGPSFIFGVLGGAVFKSAAAGAFLYAVQIVSAVLVCRLTAKKQYAPAKAVAKPPQPESFAAAFSESVRRAGMSAIQICMFITVFSPAIFCLPRAAFCRRRRCRWFSDRWSCPRAAQRWRTAHLRFNGSCASRRRFCPSAA